MTPESEEELSAVLAERRDPVLIRGGGTRGISMEASVLETGRLSGIELYEPGALTLVAGAGTPLAEIEKALAEGNQRLAFEPMDHRGLLESEGEPTIGGIVAANISGPRRIQVGACRDHLLGVRFVDGSGSIIKNGGRVMKNVTGYDLVKLMAGSWGTLGVLSQVSLKVLPESESEATLLLPCPDVATAVSRMSAALGSPFEVTGAACAPSEGTLTVMLRLEGFEESVAYRAKRLADQLGEVSVVSDRDESRRIWREIRDVSAFHGTTGDVWRISVKPGDAAEVSSRVEAEALSFDWGGGLIWALVDEGSDLRQRIGPFSGHATLVRATTDTRTRFGMFQPEPAPLAAISAGLRERFDPRGILNPGLMKTPAHA